ncbi:hypothetical protein HanRHA438_Chr05g0211691 [Helianthus annuus]|nr:hypothetical protein HanRHA438_Chr05g0211691 [Helianthus annuus]
MLLAVVFWQRWATGCWWRRSWGWWRWGFYGRLSDLGVSSEGRWGR